MIPARLAASIRRRLGSKPPSAPVPAEPVAGPPVEEPDAQARIRTLLSESPVVLFMKGDPDRPQCGFSARTVGVLHGLGVDFEHVDVLMDPDVREGIKAYNDWPTIPQLYVDGEFVGGCDIVLEDARRRFAGRAARGGGPRGRGDVQCTAAEVVAGWLEQGVPFEFLDVRTHQEFEWASVEGARLLTADQLPALEALPRDTRIAFRCHHGVRSQAAARAFQTLGFSELHNVVGGIEAWSIEVDRAFHATGSVELDRQRIVAQTARERPQGSGCRTRDHRAIPAVLSAVPRGR